ncbi:MAG: hypothetical protein JO266_03865 [Acidobacteria bacterium]|nr:hypothetical protein [Acidobacteriota bacterium]
MQDIIREPVELIDEDLDFVAGGGGHHHGHHKGNANTDVNVALVDQDINQTQIGGIGNDQAAANVSSVTQS